jgi:hypothetical protein
LNERIKLSPILLNALCYPLNAPSEFSRGTKTRDMGSVESTSQGGDGHGWHGEHYQPNSGGAYESGYERGYEDGALGYSSDDVIGYVIAATTESGSQGYADGYNDAHDKGSLAESLADSDK